MKKSHQPGFWFLQPGGVADFSVHQSLLPLTISYTPLGYNWVFGRGMCKVKLLSFILNMYTSVFSLATSSALGPAASRLSFSPGLVPKPPNPKIGALTVSSLIWILAP
uniref:Uncharacterized protein n=1 Tax=Sphaerodactylus townsendi TaxID=933632 RepID=A0ACB8FZM3_9SAUR